PIYPDFRIADRRHNTNQTPIGLNSPVENTKSPANFHPPGFLIYPIPFPQFFTGKKLYSFP
ncbi:MAG TPA: hypothetical protein PKD78_08420, partial [Saprospiraceae bacterium]|nr:hypothetical protein [Saprospiraceae bacterium]